MGKIERICFSLSEAEMLTPGVQGEWSVKDILVHLSAWEKYLLDRLSYVMTGQPPLYPAMTSWDDVHRFNAQVYAENKDSPAHLRGDRVPQPVPGSDDRASRRWMTNSSAMPYSYDFPDDHLTPAAAHPGKHLSSITGSTAPSQSGERCVKQSYLTIN